MTRVGRPLVAGLVVATTAAMAGGYLLLRPHPGAAPAPAPPTPAGQAGPTAYSNGTGAAKPGDPLPGRLSPLAEQINAKFSRVAPTAIPWIVDNPSPREMETFMAAVQANVSGDRRGAEKILRAAIAAETDPAVRDKFVLRLCDVLLLEATPESRKEARETLMKLGERALYFDMQVNVLVYLRRLDSDLAKEASRTPDAATR